MLSLYIPLSADTMPNVENITYVLSCLRPRSPHTDMMFYLHILVIHMSTVSSPSCHLLTSALPDTYSDCGMHYSCSGLCWYTWMYRYICTRWLPCYSWSNSSSIHLQCIYRYGLKRWEQETLQSLSSASAAIKRKEESGIEGEGLFVSE